MLDFEAKNAGGTVCELKIAKEVSHLKLRKIFGRGGSGQFANTSRFDVSDPIIADIVGAARSAFRFLGRGQVLLIEERLPDCIGDALKLRRRRVQDDLTNQSEKDSCENLPTSFNAWSKSNRLASVLEVEMFCMISDRKT